MPLDPGAQLGPYRIAALIGKGGMGEVYRALDTRLNRDVALKTSRAQFSERFRREAEAVASLNHPNICTLYDVGPDHLVMEFIEGPTLADRIKQGPLPLEEAVAIAKQIAAALEHAHEKGVIHRDLKPANIKLRPDGPGYLVKVLDFGLAKLGTGSSSHTSHNRESNRADDADLSPTLTMGMTEAGMILGTASYMAPEQAKAMPVDKRADIFSFGVVLHEMVTGQRIFTGETVSDTLAQVILKEPDYAKVPDQLKPLLRWCLEKEPSKRLRDIGDAMRVLDEAWGQPSPAAAPAASTKRSYLPWIATAAVALALAAVSALHFRETPPATPLRIITLLPPDSTAFDFGTGNAIPALSPDGTYIVFGARPADGRGNTQLYLRRLDSLLAQPLPGTEGGYLPFWSPDGRWIGFANDQDRKLKKIDVQGGPPVPLTDLAAPMRGASWSPQGVIVFSYNNQSPILKVSSAGGPSTPATKVEKDQANGNRSPWFLPDGNHFLYTAPGDTNKILAGSLDTPGAPGKPVADAESNAAFSQGHLLFIRGGTLFAQPFDDLQLQTTGEAYPIATGVPTFMTPSRLAGFAVSSTGLLAYQPGGSAGGTDRLTWVDRTGKQLSTVGEVENSLGNIALSPKQDLLLGALNAGTDDLWIWDMARGIKTRFTFQGNNSIGVWSPDGADIIYRNVLNGKNSLFRKASNGSGTEQRVLESVSGFAPSSWSPDAKELLVTVGAPNRVAVLTLGNNAAQPKEIIAPNGAPAAAGRFSPDGKWIVYVSAESGVNQVYVAPYPGPGGKRQISATGALQPRWSRDGKEVFFLSLGGDLMSTQVSVRNGALDVGETQRLFGGVPTSGAGMPYDVSADGKRFIVIRSATTAATAQPPLTLIENWPALIKK